MHVVVGSGTGENDPEITFSHYSFGPGESVFDTLIHPSEFSNVSFVNNSSSATLLVVEGKAGVATLNAFVENFETQATLAVSNGNLNHYLAPPGDFSFDSTFSYELAFAEPLLDNAPGSDNQPELLFTAQDGNSYIFIEPLEAPNGDPLAGSSPYLVDTNGWYPATDWENAGNVAQRGGTELYFKAIDLSMLGTQSAQYFRVSSASNSTPGVTDFNARAAPTGLSAIGIDTSNVPEPSSALLVLLALGGFSLRRGRS